MGFAKVIVDASALLAILFKEPEILNFETILTESLDDLVMSPVNYLEVCLRIDRGDMKELSENLDEVLKRFNIEVTTITAEQAYRAREAYRKFGKGNHEARLNLGDCFAYALAKTRNEPLLFKGDDFRQTDVEAAS